MEYAADLKFAAERIGGSNPLSRTKKMAWIWQDEEAVLKTVERDERFVGSSPSRVAIWRNGRVWFIAAPR